VQNIKARVLGQAIHAAITKHSVNFASHYAQPAVDTAYEAKRHSNLLDQWCPACDFGAKLPINRNKFIRKP
jgi:hypothetical protein